VMLIKGLQMRHHKMKIMLKFQITPTKPNIIR